MASQWKFKLDAHPDGVWVGLAADPAQIRRVVFDAAGSIDPEFAKSDAPLAALHAPRLDYREASRLRAELGHDFALVTPGVRPAGSGHGDQVRVVTPAEAVAAGASHIVVGRPITEATDPAAEARAILAQIGSWKNSPQTGETV